jgi:hypothetical protein
MKGATMQKLILSALLAGSVASAHAETEPELWFGDGLAYYEHPCGLQAFAKYGYLDTPEVRRNYEITKTHPELCSRLFP